MIDHSNTIVAPITASGGAVCVIRLSGRDSLAIVGNIFRRTLSDRVATFGSIHHGKEIVDEVVAVYYKSPRSYTGEDCVEISCHGSAYITNEIIRLLISRGAVMATAGEFTLRAFLNGKMDLSQAEAVADIIASDSRASSRVALQQMRGGYSEELRVLSDDLLNILSLLELELDFGEEDVEFADRKMMTALIASIYEKVYHLSNSFRLGNVLKNGVPVAIVGKPNVGKSTLLNRLLGEERSIVSSIAGTTRDFIEEVLIIDGIAFRFIDTAGLRVSEDEIERIGIERSYEKLRNASVVLQLVESFDDIEELHLAPNQKQIIVLNKCDLHTDSNKNVSAASGDSPFRTTNTDSARQIAGALSISAKLGSGIDALKEKLLESIGVSDYDSSSTVVSNSRHFEALEKSRDSFERAMSAIDMNLPTDIISTEIRIALSHLGEITGKITTDDILANIFSKFCIGK